MTIRTKNTKIGQNVTNDSFFHSPCKNMDGRASTSLLQRPVLGQGSGGRTDRKWTPLAGRYALNNLKLCTNYKQVKICPMIFFIMITLIIKVDE